MKSFEEIRKLISRVSIKIFDITFRVRCEVDNKYDAGRTFIQVIYHAKCNKTGKEEIWSGRKFYLSDYMTDDEIIKTCYAAFKASMEHETMEAFRVDDKVLFNPHTHFEALLSVSNKEIRRESLIQE